MPKILIATLAAAVLSLTCMTAAQASTWNAAAHYGFEDLNFHDFTYSPPGDNNPPPPGDNGPSPHMDDVNTDPSPTDVPEPGTFALFGAGLLGCLLMANRLRRRNPRT